MRVAHHLPPPCKVRTQNSRVYLPPSCIPSTSGNQPKSCINLLGGRVPHLNPLFQKAKLLSAERGVVFFLRELQRQRNHWFSGLMNRLVEVGFGLL